MLDYKLTSSEESSDYDSKKIFKKNDEIKLDEFTNLKQRNLFDEDSNSKSPELDKLDSLTIDKKDKNQKTTKFLSFNEINNLNFLEIYNLLIKTEIIIFIDEYKLESVNTCCFTKYFFNKTNLRIEEFPGCIFISFDFKLYLTEYLNKLNSNVINSELGHGSFINKNNEKVYSICFDEGEIYKDCIYKKLEIRNKILFIPINKYKLKLTEYKIRGFCQIMEELGARTIEIYFSNKKKTKNNNRAKLNANIGTIAGNLGFSLNNEDQNNENRKYKLTYPSFNTIMLNENYIREKIKKKEFIISENNYNSNLELQYVVSSRCRHFITKYSTSFTLDTSSSINKNLAFKLQKFNIGSDININFSNKKNNHITIKTDVLFSDELNIKDNLLGSCVNYDNIGFNFLIKSLTKENFRNKGIFKIMEFIEYYCKEKLKKINDNRDMYKKIKYMLIKIRDNFTINEYADLLCNYFSINSEWKHFEYFIDLLSKKTISYDKLGYLVLIEDNDIKKNDKILKIINFIHESCIHRDKDNKNKLILKFWKMLDPFNKRLKYFFVNKIEFEYNLLEGYNWYSLNKIINDISNYNLISKEDSNELIFEKLYKNIFLGYPYWEFYTNMLPFIRKICSILYFNSIKKQNEKISLEDKIDENNEKQYFNSALIDSINFESFRVNRITTYNKLIEYLNVKLNKIYLANELINELCKILNDKLIDDQKKKTNFTVLEEIHNYIITNKEFMKKYRYFDKKIKLIFGSKDSDYLKGKIINFFMTSENNINSDKERVKYFINRIFCYNEKIKINKLPANYLGFDIIFKKFLCGDREIECINTLIPFSKKMMRRMIDIKFKNNCSEYKKSILLKEKFPEKKDDKYINELKNIKSYYSFVNLISKILNNKLSNKIDDKIIKDILNS